MRRERRQGNIRYLDTRIDREYADSIVAIDDTPVKTVEEFSTIMDRHSPGERVRIRVLRAGTTEEVSVRLGEA